MVAALTSRPTADYTSIPVVSTSAKSRIVSLYMLLIVFNVGAWVWALMAFHNHPVELGTAFLAYTFGLRHAADADHIAAIDNVTRKLMQQNQRPVAIGLPAGCCCCSKHSLI